MLFSLFTSTHNLYEVCSGSSGWKSSLLLAPKRASDQSLSYDVYCFSPVDFSYFLTYKFSLHPQLSPTSWSLSLTVSTWTAAIFPGLLQAAHSAGSLSCLTENPRGALKAPLDPASFLTITHRYPPHSCTVSCPNHSVFP